MPAFLGATQIMNIGGTANVHFGDLAWLSPKTATKAATGGSGGATAAFNITTNFVSINNALNTSVVDQTITANA